MEITERNPHTHETVEPELLFFLGAGASVAAGVPDTFNLVNEFLQDLEKRRKKPELEHCKKILEILEKSELASDGKVDVELLLEALDQLENINDCIPLKFFRVSDCVLGPYIESRAKRHLKNELEGFIKKTGLVSKDDIQYLKDLLLFIEEQPPKPLDIFSVNYDICIEQFCDTFEKEYVDGFYLKWEPKSLNRPGVDVRLHKIHGSIIWYRTDKGSHVKIPIQSEKAEIKLTTGEKASALILYPMRKLEYTEPLMDLLMILKRKLRRARFAFVVGYSFRDDQIRRIFWNAARKNKELILFLVSPNAHEVYEERLRNYDTSIPSDLEGRVICLPYKFEEVLHLLKNRYLKELKRGLNLERKSATRENQGLAADWQSCLDPFINCEYLDKIQQLHEKGAWKHYIELPTSTGVRVARTAFKVFLTSLTSNNDSHKKRWFFELIHSFFDLFDDTRLTVRCRQTQFGLEIEPLFTLPDQSYLTFKRCFELIQSMLDECNSKAVLMKDEQTSDLNRVEEALRDLLVYFNWFGEGKIALRQYQKMRKEGHPKLVNQVKEEMGKQSPLTEKIGGILDQIERQELKKIVNKTKFVFADTLKLLEKSP